MILLRALICTALCVAPVLLFVVASRKVENVLFLLFPAIGVLPGLVAACLIFAPLELWLDAGGHGGWKNLAVPLAGGLWVAALLLLMSAGRLSLTIGRIAGDPLREGGPLLVWVVLGIVWGVLWRLSAPIAAAVRA